MLARSPMHNDQLITPERPEGRTPGRADANILPISIPVPIHAAADAPPRVLSPSGLSSVRFGRARGRSVLKSRRQPTMWGRDDSPGCGASSLAWRNKVDRQVLCPPSGSSPCTAEQLPSGHSLAGILCYTFQIYFDLSGYSDMAIGMGRMICFQFPENFQTTRMVVFRQDGPSL